MLCFKYSTRIPLVHDASIMVFPLLEWCVRLWPAPLSLSLSLSLSLGKVRGREREKGQRSTTKTIVAVRRTSIQGEEEAQERAEAREVPCARGSCGQTGEPAARGRASASRRVPGLGICKFGLSPGAASVLFRVLE